ncbi:hypothetical protein LTR53_011109 [Teratosphaeriaceae sp. CCFEE 6253]|nr:hypothetical protein LTR53_011109 [Teratosphaeriaceae sp. CCFEE 6253]
MPLSTTHGVALAFFSIALHIAVLFLLASKRALQPPYSSPRRNPVRAKPQRHLSQIVRPLGVLSAATSLLAPYAFANADPLSQCALRVVAFFYACQILPLALTKADTPPTRLLRRPPHSRDEGADPQPAPLATARDHAAYVWALLTEMRYRSFDIYVPQPGRTDTSPNPYPRLWTLGPPLLLPALNYLLPLAPLKSALLLLVIQHGLETLHTLLHSSCLEPLFSRPFAAASLGEFWGVRWHASASPFLQALAYKPVRKRTGSRAAGVVATFALTGLWHAYAAAPISTRPWEVGLLVWTWFVSQGVGCLAERAVWGKRQGGMVQRVCVWAFALGGAGVCWRAAECSPLFIKSKLIDIVVRKLPGASTFAVHEDVKHGIRTVALGDDADPDIFNFYLQFVYRQPSVDVDVPRDAPGAFDFLLRGYVLAAMLGDLTTANQVIDRIVARCAADGIADGYLKVCEAWNATPPDSPLRRLIVDVFTHAVVPEVLSTLIGGDDTPRALLAAIAREFSRRREDLLDRYEADREEAGALVEDVVHGGRSRDRPLCWYHQHDEMHPACGDGEKFVGVSEGE